MARSMRSGEVVIAVRVTNRCPSDDGGYAMAMLLVAIGVMAILWTAAMPVWSQIAKREREAELIFRGGQYARAIELYQRKYANANPAAAIFPVTTPDCTLV